MTYGEAKQRLLNPHNGSDDRDYRKDEIARNIVMLSFAENMERAASALGRIATALESPRRDAGGER